MASRKIANSIHQIQVDVQNIIKDGGEGLILRQINSFYEGGRSTSLIKLKVVFLLVILRNFAYYIQAVQGDKEGIVVAVDLSQNVTIKLYGSNPLPSTYVMFSGLTG